MIIFAYICQISALQNIYKRIPRHIKMKAKAFSLAELILRIFQERQLPYGPLLRHCMYCRIVSHFTNDIFYRFIYET